MWNRWFKDVTKQVPCCSEREIGTGSPTHTIERVREAMEQWAEVVKALRIVDASVN